MTTTQTSTQLLEQLKADIAAAERDGDRARADRLMRAALPVADQVRRERLQDRSA